MELRHLRYFRAVAEERHFGRAAARLHMAQPPLSQQVRQLEDELGVQLLRRSTRRVDLTPAGRPTSPGCARSSTPWTRPAEEAQRIGSGLEGRLVVGCVGSATYSLLPALARALRDELPGIDFAFRGEMLSPDQVVALRDGSIDLALLRPLGDRGGTPTCLARAAPASGTSSRCRRATASPPRTRVRMADLRDEGLVAARRSRPLGHARRRGRAVPRRRLRADDPARGGRDLDPGDLRGCRPRGRGRPRAGVRARRRRRDVPPARRPGPDGPARGHARRRTTRRRWPAP